MFDHLAMPCKDSDYTITIVLVCWSKRMILELWALLSSHRSPLLECPALMLSSTTLRRSQCILTTLPWLPSCTDMYQNSPWWQSCERCNNFCFHSGCHCSLDSNSMVSMWRALIGTSFKLDAYNYTSSLERELSMSWWVQTESAQSSTRSV